MANLPLRFVRIFLLKLVVRLFALGAEDRIGFAEIEHCAGCNANDKSILKNIGHTAMPLPRPDVLAKPRPKVRAAEEQLTTGWCMLLCIAAVLHCRVECDVSLSPCTFNCTAPSGNC